MKLHKKTFIIFCLAIALCCGAKFAFAQGTDANTSKDNLVNDFNFSYSHDPNFGGGSGDTPGLAKLLISVFVVLVLGIGAIYLSKKVMPKFTQSTGKRIKVTETVYLGPRKSLHLVKVGKQAFLIGSTNENITKIADVELKDFQADLEAQSVKIEE